MRPQPRRSVSPNALARAFAPAAASFLAALLLAGCGPSARDCGPNTAFNGKQCLPAATTCVGGEHFDANLHACLLDGPERACAAGTHDSGSDSCIPDHVCGSNNTRPDPVTGQCAADMKDWYRGRWTSNVRVSPAPVPDVQGMPDAFIEPNMAVDKHGNIVIAYMDTLGQGIEVSQSSDGGKSFHLVFTRNPSDASAFAVTDQGTDHRMMFAGDVSMAYNAKSDALYLSWIDYFDRYCHTDNAFCDPNNNQGIGGAVRTARSSDGGKSWGPISTVNPDGGYYFGDRPFLTVGSDGTPWISFSYGPAVDAQSDEPVGTWVARATEDAARNTLSWTMLDNPFSLFNIAQSPMIAAGTSLFLGFDDQDQAGNRYFGLSLLGATGQSRPLRLNAVYTGFSPEVRGVAVQGIDQVAGMLPNQDIVGTFRARKDGSVGLGYALFTPQGRSKQWPSLYGDASPAQGWVNDDPYAQDVMEPFLVTDSSGAHAAWYDDRDGHWGVYESSSADGIHWTQNSRVSDVTFDEQGDPTQILYDYLALYSDGPTLYAAWADTRPHDPDGSGRQQSTSAIYFAREPNPLR